MASKSFTLADGPEVGDKGPCGKCCMYSSIIAFVVLLGGAGVYFYQNSYTCSYPELDETGLSNWTSGADHIAFSCFPGYFLEGESNLVVAKCEDGLWNPLPPSCNSLPLRIDCQVNNQSLTGNITMWQESADAPTHIYGLINYTLAVKHQGHVMEHVILSKKTCNISHVVPDEPHHLLHPEPRSEVSEVPEGSTSTGQPTLSSSSTIGSVDDDKDDDDKTDDDDDKDDDNKDDDKDDEDKFDIQNHGKLLRIQFNSTKLKAFKKAEVFMNIIFIDPKTTATLVSVHQENLTLVMTGSEPVHAVNSSWNMDRETKRALQGMGLEFEI